MIAYLHTSPQAQVSALEVMHSCQTHAGTTGNHLASPGYQCRRQKPPLVVPVRQGSKGPFRNGLGFPGARSLPLVRFAP